MIRKLVFDKIKHTDTISYTFDGINYESISASEALANGISIPDTCTNYDLIKVKGDSDNEISDFYYLVNSSNINNKSLWQNLKRIKIGDDITSIGQFAFRDCNNLTSIIIPDSVTSIGNYAFYNCSNLTSITIPESVTLIVSGAFTNCSSLVSITIPNSITSIESNVFMNCSSLTSITIPDSVTSIGVSTFSNCSGLTSITIPEGVTSIGDSAFYYCSNLTSITIPNSVTSIGSHAFYNCSNLTSITIPNSVTSIDGSAFNGCSNLINIDINENNCYFSVENQVLFNKDKTKLISYFNPSSTSYEIPNTVTSIVKYAFWNCSNLTSITISNSVTSIGSGAFYGCSNLTSIEIPDSVTSIGMEAFSQCSSLSSIIIPDSVNFISTSAFYSCSNLASIKLPESITSIKYNTFAYCWNLSEIVIPESVTSIEDYTFHDCYKLAAITIPNSVTEIGDKAFLNCSGLTSFIYEGTLKNWKNIIKKNIGLSQELIDNVTATLTAEAIAELESQTILLSDLSDILTNSGIINTPETAVRLHIIPAEGRTEWAYDPENSIDELQELSDIIAASEIYVDLTNTDLTHNTYTDIVDNLLEDEDLATWDIQGYGYNNVDDSFTTEDLKPFPSVFRNNEYLVALTIPAGDNYSEDGVLAGCTNLKHIAFAGDELWKIGIMGLETVDDGIDGKDFYFTYVGQENFIYPEETDDWVTVLDSEEEFISILINGYMVGQQNGEDKWHQASLMWYYDCWEDYEDNPYVIRPATNEIMLSGTRGLPNARILSLNEDVEVSDVEDIVSDGETEIAPAKAIEFDDNVVIENGEIHLDGSNSSSNE